MNLLKNMIVAGAATLAMAAAASAGTLKLDFQGVGPGQGVSYSKNSGTSFTGTTAGVFNWKVVGNGTTAPGFTDGMTVKSFCIELGQFVADPTTFNCVSPDQAPNYSPPGPMGLARAAILGDLFARYHSTAINGTSTQAAAFQLCVWEITHEEGWENAGQASVSDTSMANLLAIKSKLTVADTGTVGDANVNTFRIADGSDSARTLANTWLGNLLSGCLLHSTLIGLTAGSNQDQIIMVPIPAPAMLAGLGLIGALALRRRMKA